MSDYDEWEIPQWNDDAAPDKSDFLLEDGRFMPPLYMWAEYYETWRAVCLSNRSDAYEMIQLTSASQIDDLIKRLERAKEDVFSDDSSDSNDN